MITLQGVGNYAGLNGKEKITYDAESSALGVLVLFGEEKAIRKIRAAVRENNLKLEIGDTLELFKEE